MEIKLNNINILEYHHKKGNIINFTCPSCKNDRIISYHQAFNIKHHISSGKCQICQLKSIISSSGRFKNKLIPWNKGKKGLQVGWNKGKKMPDGFGEKIRLDKLRHEKISRSLKGKPLSDSHKLALTGIPHLPMRGSNHHSWKGGITPLNHSIRNSLEYDMWRRAVLQKDDYTCQKCKKRGGYLNAHHIKQFALYPELRFIVSNGITMCEECHKEKNLHKWRIKQCN